MYDMLHSQIESSWCCTRATDRTISMKFIILLLLLPFCSGSSSNEVQCLKDLKESLGDPDGSLSTWNFSHTSICRFTGVDCWNPHENRVISLHLSSMGLQGSFPRGLQFCSTMTALDLSGNNLSGPLPADINRQLQYMTSLDLSNNSFSGEIPSGVVNITYLDALNLQHNRFTGRIPDPETKTYYLTRLSEFNVADNYLSGPIPVYLQRFPAKEFAGNGGLCGPPLDRECKNPFHLHRVNDASSIGAAAGFVVGFVVAFYFPHWFVFCGGLRPYIFRVCG